MKNVLMKRANIVKMFINTHLLPIIYECLEFIGNCTLPTITITLKIIIINYIKNIIID